MVDTVGLQVELGSLTYVVRNFSIAIGPVLGGLLANFLGFR